MTPVGSGHLLPAPFDGGLVLVDERHQRLHLLNPAAAAIWTVLDAGLSREEAAAALASHTGRDPAACADDISAMEDQWRMDGTFDAVPPSLERQAGLPRDGDDVAAFYEVSGIRLELRSESGEVADRVAAALGECLAPAGDAALRLSVRVDAEGTLVLLADGEPWLTAGDPGEIVGGVFHLLLQSGWGKDGWLTMIHGAALKRDGTAILFPAPSGAGKTTLAAYLSRRGFALMADDRRLCGPTER